MPPRLCDLPAEVQERVASSCDAAGAIALAQTCRSLRSACWNRFVFLNIIATSSSNWQFQHLLPGPPSRPHTNWDILSIAKFALADQYACELRGGLDGEFKGHCFDQALRWAPQLIVAQHPFTSSSWLALKLSEVVHGVLLDLRGVFCYTATMLGTDDDGNDMVATSTEALQQLPEDVMKARTRWKALRALGAFGVLLRQNIKKHLIRNRPYRVWSPHSVAAPDDLDPSYLHGNSVLYIQPHFWNPANIPQSIAHQLAADEANSLPVITPPSAVDIPMQPMDRTYDLPMPFSGLTQRQVVEGERSPWETWHNSHVATMCLPQYLKNCTWQGYFLDSRPTEPGILPGFHPMVDIEFERVFEKVAEPGSVQAFGVRKPTLEVRGRGRDAIGGFELTGTIKPDGAILMKKDYLTTHWFWQMSMTPFGMFGTWGLRDGFHANVVALGAVWLWRKDWTSANTV